MSIFSSCDAAPNSGVITYSETSTSVHDRGVALPDAGRLDDHEVEAGGLCTPAIDVGERRRAPRRRPRGWPASGRTRRSRVDARSSGCGRRAGRRRRAGGSGRSASTATRSLSSLVEAQPADQLVGERRLARAAGAGDAEDRARCAAGGRAHRGRRAAGSGAGLEHGDRPGRAPPGRPSAASARSTPAAREVDVARGRRCSLTIPARPRRWPSSGEKIAHAVRAQQRRSRRARSRRRRRRTPARARRRARRSRSTR